LSNLLEGAASIQTPRAASSVQLFLTPRADRRIVALHFILLVMDSCILVVDDSAYTRRRLIADLPEGIAARILEAKDGREALQAWKRHRPRLVFLDIAMPGVDGLTVLETMQNEKHSARVVVVTSESAQVHVRAKALGAHRVLHKPWKRQDVVQAARDAGLVPR
ncbi:MAG: response regulator transcription factor, partial [Myxococcota bacterium]